MIENSRSFYATVSDLRIAFAFYVGLLTLSALDAYDVGRVPVQWIMQLGTIGIAGYLIFRYRLPRLPAIGMFTAFAAWAALITAFGTAFGHLGSFMPPGATTPYPIFIVLRVITFVFYAGCLYLVWWLAHQELGDHVVQATVLVAVGVAALAIYIYLAQAYHLPEPPRSRLGTSGAAQAVHFTYDFHRATGTFREPSFLAAWLIVPFFLCFFMRAFAAYAAGVVIAGTLLLTGSLSGIAAIVFGAIVTLAASVAFGSRAWRGTELFGLGAGAGVLVLALGIFYAIAVSNTGHEVNLFGTLGGRILVILKGGLSQSDRNLVYGYVGHNPPSLFGVGLGNSNLLLTHYLKTTVVASFISLYLDTIYATGAVGLVLLFVYLLAPLWTIVRRPELLGSGRVVALAGSYISWLVIFSVAMEELSFMFAVVSALLSFEIFVSESRPAVGDRVRSVTLPADSIAGAWRRLAHPVDSRMS